MDTELNIGWFHDTRVRDFRIKLWRHLLGSSRTTDIGAWDPTSFTERWRKIAQLNAKAPPDSRRGLAIQHDLDQLKRVAKEFPLVPEVFISTDEGLSQLGPQDLIEIDDSTVDDRPAVS
jgi:hypothetical protein